MTLASTARGNAQLFWGEYGTAPAFFRERSRTFMVSADGEPHEYTVEIEAERDLTTIRFDPSRGTGTVRVSSMKLQDDEDSVLYEWNFK
jgi:hypothetical protein